jgi:tetratricopeptide (TPR) repeat protein
VASAILEFYSGQFETAVQAGKVAYELDPHGIFSVSWYSVPLIWTGRFKENHAILDKWNEEMPNHVWWQFSFMLLNSLQGNTAESLTLIHKIIDENLSYAWNDTVCIWAFAVVYTLGDHIDEALRWLEHGLEIGCFNYPFLSELDPNLAKLHSNPRFQTLMERVKYEWENFEV